MYVWKCMCMYVYVCICMYMYVCVYVYVCICMFMSVYVCMCVCMYVYVCLYIYMCVYVHVYVFVYMYMCACMRVCIYLCRYLITSLDHGSCKDAGAQDPSSASSSCCRTVLAVLGCRRSHCASRPPAHSSLADSQKLRGANIDRKDS